MLIIQFDTSFDKEILWRMQTLGISFQGYFLLRIFTNCLSQRSCLLEIDPIIKCVIKELKIFVRGELRFYLQVKRYKHAWDINLNPVSLFFGPKNS